MMLPFADWLPHQRWYAGRGRTIVGVDTTSVTALADDLEHVLLQVRFVDGDPQAYQVVVGWDRAPADEFVGVARIGEADGRTGYDALYSERTARELLGMILAGHRVADLRFEAEPEAGGVDDSTARVIDAEQSNSSVVFNGSAILKLFRRVVPGLNPDLELNRALARAGNPYVARLLGAIESVDEHGAPLSLATLNQFAANSADGWSMAVASARDLMAQPDYGPDQVGGDFAGEAHRLGEAVASVHGTLGDELGREIDKPPVEHMIRRLHTAAAAVPQIAQHIDAATEILRRATYPSIIQRIHGDLHLGQALRTPESWLIIDFEGEPGQPIDERRRPDSPMRDVAAMLRSFDYAAYQLLIGDTDNSALDERAREWAARNRAAFCDGYAAVSGVDPREHADLLAAYELDKAAYEAAYETRHRPSWLWIPLHSIGRILGGGTQIPASAEDTETVSPDDVRPTSGGFGIGGVGASGPGPGPAGGTPTGGRRSHDGHTYAAGDVPSGRSR
ncbi:MAG TPA: maltokinase [Micromonosporaceae bacterium]|jgi:maltokinase|nr:maltokinase [Micromonosporaceae bacterium]